MNNVMVSEGLCSSTVCVGGGGVSSSSQGGLRRKSAWRMMEGIIIMIIIIKIKNKNKDGTCVCVWGLPAALEAECGGRKAVA